MAITIGADPEVFLMDENYNAKAACGLFGGEKGAPVPLPGLTERNGFGLQEDNVMLEYNIPPADDSHQFMVYVRQALMMINELVRTKGMRINTECSLLFPQEELIHPGAQTFGCAVDNDAHQQGQKCPGLDRSALDRPGGAMRYAGGHVHIGYNRPGVPKFVVAAFADIFLGLFSISDGDKQGDRRLAYGTPGRYRETPYGIEYRVLSNWWIHDEHRAYAVGCAAMSLGNYIENTPMDTIRSTYAAIPWVDVRQAILAENRGLTEDIQQFVRTEFHLEV